MATQTSQTIRETPQGRLLSEDEARKIQENLARENFDMSLDEFIKAWKAGEFDEVLSRLISPASRFWEIDANSHTLFKPWLLCAVVINHNSHDHFDTFGTEVIAPFAGVRGGGRSLTISEPRLASILTTV